MIAGGEIGLICGAPHPLPEGGGYFAGGFAPCTPFVGLPPHTLHRLFDSPRGAAEGADRAAPSLENRKD
jgi:hypothetical protein